MARLHTYLVITVGLMVLLNLAGIHTLGGMVLGTLGMTPDNFQNFRATSLFTTFLVSALAALTVTGVIMGTFGRGSGEIAVTALYATPLVALIGEMTAIMMAGFAVEGSSFNMGYIIFLVTAPLLVAYVISLYDWVRGRD